MMTHTAAAPLRLVPPAVPVRGIGPRRVLTDDTLDRLRALNVVARRLRAWGYTVAAQEIHGPLRHPYLRITLPEGVSITALLDATSDRRWLPADGKKHLHAMLDGVQIEWRPE